jgi:hypothetical protein
MDFKTFASKLPVKYIEASTVSSNAYILALHIASITFNKETGKHTVFMRNVSEFQKVCNNKWEVDKFIRGWVAQFYVDSLCNVKENEQIVREVKVPSKEDLIEDASFEPTDIQIGFDFG